jgi:hypothetical protein
MKSNREQLSLVLSVRPIFGGRLRLGLSEERIPVGLQLAG